MKEKEILQLCDDLREGSISAADFLRLEAELIVDPTARHLYYERCKLETLLEAEAKAEQSDPHAQASAPSNQLAFADRSPLPLWLPWALAAGLLGLLIAVSTVSLQSRSNTDVAESVAAGFGVVGNADNAVWADQPAALAEGALLPGGPFRLKSGVAQLELFSGVALVVEGPAEFEIHSAMEMSLQSGRIRALVPPAAQGFRVQLSEGEIVDLGTEFAVDLSGQETEVHVLDGEVEWHAVDQPKRQLLGGSALRLQSPEQAIVADPSRFQSIADLQESRLRRLEDSQLRWRETRDRLLNDPRVVVYYPMDAADGWNRTIENAATSGPAFDGSIIAAVRGKGRWEKQKDALDFRPAGSRVRLSVPGEFQALTFSVWAKIDSIEREFNSLFLTDSYETGEPHWQITREGQLFLSVRAREEWISKAKSVHSPVLSSPFWDSTTSGRWVHLASTIDLRTRVVAHYLDGERIHRETLSEDLTPDVIRIGSSTLGNWSLPLRDDPSFAIRNLNGSIDEFILFAESLSAKEISVLHQTGRP